VGQNQNNSKLQIAATQYARRFQGAEVGMAITVVLAVCLDPMHLGTQGAVWGSKGYVFLAANSVKEAINQFKAGDFDLVLLGQSIPADSRERLTSQIRATGSLGTR
jgi:hypothetical protein